ncbi:uncharacterized protein KD926_010099 [Aspergillus affinis]|uniref:uncharacterized protein n=1 Tax=Aspergillus affinis TaxID=1070780 RepID=UPI0022FE9655|nr:uncharacterized protein KD926_010099 [Aspergillus affinis]KAI9038997.1 hypothetical protein KD926_010099 [Aspergillus affinis]
MEYSSIDPKTYGVTLRPSPPRRENPGHENHEQVKPASNQTAPSATDQAHGSEPENTRAASNDSSHGAKSLPQITASNPTPTVPSPSRRKRARQPRTSQREEAKKRRRQELARRLGREEDTINSDDERQYWDAVEQRYAAEEARRNALSPEERRQEDIQKEAKQFKKHIKPQFERGWTDSVEILLYYPIFVFQTAPPSNRGAKCRIGSCTVTINPGDYRIAVTPGSHNYYQNPDYYHVKCFEELLDLSSPHYLARFECDITKYIPDIGAQHILKEYLRRWKVRIGLLGDDERAVSDPASNLIYSEWVPSNTSPGGEATITDQSDNSGQDNAMAPGLPPTNQPGGNEEEDEWRRADDIWAEIREQRVQRLQVDPGTSLFFLSFFHILRVSLGEDDPAVEWDITDYVVREDDPDYDERHLLSTALSDWDIDRRIATTDIEKLNEKGLEFRDSLGEKTIEKIQRYAAMWMPNIQSVFFSCVAADVH